MRAKLILSFSAIAFFAFSAARMLAGGNDFPQSAHCPSDGDKVTKTHYAYDANGNMTRDRNKKIHSVSYNILNQPSEVKFDDGHITRYTYDASGTKLKAEYLLSNERFMDWDMDGPAAETANVLSAGWNKGVDIGGIVAPPGSEIIMKPVTLTTLQYSSSHIYRNGRLERVDNPYGYWAGGSFHYHITDYQGSIRAVIDENGTLEEISHYYPYGGLMGAGAMGVQPRKYGAKELDRENGLDLYDSHARWYDFATGATTTQDPLAEKYHHLSPYLWCAANPIRLIDPSGMATFWYNGKIMGDDGLDDNRILVILTTEKQFASQDGTVPGAGLSKKSLKETLKFIKENSGNTQAFADNGIAYNNSIEIESSADARQKMAEIVSADDGNGGNSDANNREYGGSVANGSVTAVAPGEVATNPNAKQANILLPLGVSTFHSHPSGTIQTEVNAGIIPRTVSTPNYVQHASIADLNNAGSYTHYVFGRYSNKVYVYNSKAIQAVIPFERFVIPK